MTSIIGLAYRATFSSLGQRIFDPLMGKRYREAYRWLMRTQWLSRDEIRALQLSQLQEILEHAYTYSPFYRRRLGEAGWEPGESVDFDRLRSLPTLERLDVQERLSEVSTVEQWHPERLSRSGSGGTTTGTPLVIYVDGWSHDRKSAVRPRDESWVGMRRGDKMATLGGFSRGLQSKTSLRTRVADRLECRTVILAYELGDENLASCVGALQRLRPKYLECYPSGLFALASYLRSTSRRLHIPIVYATGEMLYEEWRTLIREHVGELLCEAYGSAETNHIAYTCGQCNVMHVNDENLIVEIEEGTGHLLVTDLTNRATPLIRYRVGDKGVWSGEPASCGRGLSSLLSVEGRSADIIELGDGHKVAAITLPTVMIGFPSVRGYQVWQPSARRLQVLVQAPGEVPAAAIVASLARLIPDTSIEVVQVKEIPPTASGKRPVLVKDREYQGDGLLLAST